MKKAILAGVLLAAGLVTAAAQEWEVYDMFGWSVYGKRDSTMRVRDAGDGGVTFYGMASKEIKGEKGGAGYVLEPQDKSTIGLNGKRQIMLEVSGIRDTDEFEVSKLLKLELNGTPVRTRNNIGMNRYDRDFLNARNGKYIFDIADLGTVIKIEIVFFDCTVGALTLRMFVE